MKLIVTFAISISVFSCVVQAKSCHEIKNSMDESACDDYWIKRFDTQVDEIIKQSRGLNIAGTSSKEVLSWKRRIYGHCTHTDCLYEEYTKYLARISDEVVSRRVVRSGEVTSIEKKNICGKVVGLIESGELENFRQTTLDYHFVSRAKDLNGWYLSSDEREEVKRKIYHEEPRSIYKVKLSNGAALSRFGSFFTGGSCASYNIYDVESLSDPKFLDVGVDEVDDTEDEIRWAYWAHGDVPYFISGRNLLIAGSQVVSWISPTGNIRALCMLDVASSSNKWIRRDSPEICDMTTESSPEPIEWVEISNENLTQFSESEREELNNFLGLRETGTSVVRLDIDGDNVEELLVYSVTDSGAGCGSHREKMHLIASDQENLGGLIEFISELPDRQLELIGESGKYYLRVANAHGTTSVYSFADGKPKEVCESVQVNKWEVKKYFRPTSVNVR